VEVDVTAPEHGSLGEEAARLAEAVQEWLHDAAGETGEATECQACPACRMLRLVRSARPEVYAHLADAAASVSAALRELTRDGGAAPEPRRDPVQRIDLG
jgi:hypothetical protein